MRDVTFLSIYSVMKFPVSCSSLMNMVDLSMSTRPRGTVAPRTDMVYHITVTIVPGSRLVSPRSSYLPP